MEFGWNLNEKEPRIAGLSIDFPLVQEFGLAAVV